ncbi:MAG TPA: hypothetical protein VN641_13460 [Urbifossiella sp.]|nr:hypothetical protein [Urbifossiella sp.]
MRTKLFAAIALLASAVTVHGAEGLSKGTADAKSATALAFGPHGLLFIGDTAGATIYAIDTGDAKPAGDKAVDFKGIDAKVASLLGAPGNQVKINDVKVNPASGNVYLAVTRGTGAGQAAIVRVTRSGELEAVGLKDVPMAKVVIPNPAAGKGAATSITSMAFVNGKLIVAGLSNEQFASTLRSFDFPFKHADKGAAIEIFHGAHGKIETQAPIRSFVPYKVGGEDSVIATYTCTPLVKIPVSELKAGAKVKGTTVAELGNRNQPLDMIVYQKDGKDFILVANSARGVMKIPAESLSGAEPIVARPKTELAGVKYEKIDSLKGVMQLDKLDAHHAILLVKSDDGLDLKTIELP